MTYGVCSVTYLNPMGTGNYSATSNNMKLVHWLVMGGLLHFVQQEGDCMGRAVEVGFKNLGFLGF